MLHRSTDPVFTRLPDGRRAWYIPDHDRYVPYISGGAGDEPAEEPAEEPSEEPAEEPADEPADKPLGEKGEKALTAMKDQVKTLRAELKAARDEANELKKQQMTEQERAVAEALEAGRSEGLRSGQTAMFRAELRAAVAGKLVEQAVSDLTSDADGAMRTLGFSEIPVTSDGDIDGEAISQAVTSFVASRPYLAAGAPPAGSIDQGGRTPPPVKGLDEQIAEAEAKGDVRTSIRLKQQKLAALPRP